MHQSDPDAAPTDYTPEQTAAVAAHSQVSIRTPGSIQPHGVLLAVCHSPLQIQAASANTLDILGHDVAALVGQPLSDLFDAASFAHITTQLQAEQGGAQFLSAAVITPAGPQVMDIWVHRQGEMGFVEVELPQPDQGTDYGQLQRAIATLNQHTDPTTFLQMAVTEIQAITGFEHIMAYQFDPQNNGAVIAEVKPASATAYLNLHFPAIDIPQAALDLYRDCPLRFIPDLLAPPVVLRTATPDQQATDLDLSLAVLRSVDPCCIEYHQNMGTQALLILALIVDDQLWGLIACHHSTPHPLSAQQRIACDLFRQVVMLALSGKVNQGELADRTALQTRLNQMVARLAQSQDFQAQLINPDLQLADLVGATGVVVCLNDNLTLLGHTPTPDQVRALLEWVIPQVDEHCYCTPRLPHQYPAAAPFQDLASGLLVLQISRQQRFFILWFRPEVPQTVEWAGHPEAAIQHDADGTPRLCPRTSFARWQETLRGQALPWHPWEIDCVISLRHTIVNLILSKADELALLNRELMRSNQELSTFAYAASHDLKEPLRGIHNYSLFLLEDYESVLDQPGVERLQTLVRLTQRMEALIDVLLKFSRLGQTELRRQLADLNRLLERVLEVYLASRPEGQLDIRIPRPLPSVHCDPVLMSEVFTNLISNGFKYNTSPTPWVEIGYLDINQQLAQGLVRRDLFASGTTVLYVRDNGIGIRKQHLETIFQLFKRLHAKRKYGGGAGAGLTIAKKIIERHQGRIWVKSTYGKGTTFYFSLGDQILRKG